MVKILKPLLLLSLVLLSFVSFGQNVSVEVDERINEELRMKNAQLDSNKLSGFRVQIYFGSEMQSAEAAMSHFSAKYPEYSTQVYRLYQQPSWKIRVGNFYREIEAQSLLAAVREHYPDAFVVKDEIQRPPLPEISIPDMEEEAETEED